MKSFMKSGHCIVYRIKNSCRTFLAKIYMKVKRNLFFGSSSICMELVKRCLKNIGLIRILK